MRFREEGQLNLVNFAEPNSIPNFPMRFSASKRQIPKWVFFFLIVFAPIALSDPRAHEAGLYCGGSPATTNFVPIFVKEMENLLLLVTEHHWGRSRVNATYGLAQCYGDLSPMDCQLCFAAGRTKLPRCLPAVAAHIYLDGCFIRYDNYSFYAEAVDPVRDAVNCTAAGGAWEVGVGERDGFVRNLGLVVEEVTRRAVGSGGFAVGEARGVYALAQCWRTVSVEGCRECLEKAGREVRGCAPSREGRGLNPGCYLRYSTRKFYNDGGDSDDRGGTLGTGVIVAIVLCGIAVLMLSLFAAYAAYARFSKKKAETKNLGRISSLFNKSNLSFKYDTLEKATDYFNPSRKIGQGGAGSVYMGTLPNGKVVAVKRLIFNTRQWVDEFFNEVNLISGIHHKNLVKLLGCSIEGPESLLVYEYVHNKSLDQFIFDKEKLKLLKWKNRFNIVLGTAKGLAYLHGGSDMRIIHRDIKSSNVLLDENLTAKIADFGLVRCFAADKSHLSTGIAGTLGYMAPEYLVKGQLTEKADVYSFGVLVLEIVTGRKNNIFIQDSGSLLQTVWRHYLSNTLVDAIEPTIRVNFPAKESSDVLQIGLLCTQASAASRPSMAVVVQMLTDKHYKIPSPRQPPFMKTSMRETDSSLMNSSKADTRIETSSYGSTESFGVTYSSDRPSRS